MRIAYPSKHFLIPVLSFFLMKLKLTHISSLFWDWDYSNHSTEDQITDLIWLIQVVLAYKELTNTRSAWKWTVPQETLYGLITSPRIWYEIAVSAMKSLGFSILCAKTSRMHWAIEKLGKHFEIKNLRRMKYPERHQHTIKVAVSRSIRIWMEISFDKRQEGDPYC